jgi:gentisate 1,2-dioxygenase
MDDSALLADLEKNNLQALWSEVARTLSDQPGSRESAFKWPWQSIRSFADRAGDEVNMGDVERRVLLLANPAFGKRPVSTGTLIAAVQILNPGEIAEPHRHTIAALRIITEQDGGVTTVNGIKCPMVAGDLILTPAWCWHGHYNDSNRRLMWVDVLDVPLVASLDGIFFEHPNEASPKLAEAEPFSDAAWSGAGIVQSDLTWNASHSPKLRYAWADVKPTLDAIQPKNDGSREIRYINPLTGGAVMTTMDCYAIRLEAGLNTQRRRSTANTLCYVVEGSGRSEIGGKSISWTPGDIFTLPNWQWATHTADSELAYLVQVTNREMLKVLGLLREETALTLDRSTEVASSGPTANGRPV